MSHVIYTLHKNLIEIKNGEKKAASEEKKVKGMPCLSNLWIWPDSTDALSVAMKEHTAITGTYVPSDFL